MAKVAVIGAGYVGITTAVCFSHLGHDVVVADQSESRVESLRSGDCPIFEVDLPEFLSKALSGSRLSFSNSNTDSVNDADFVFLCLPTPQSEDGTADTSILLAVIDEVRSSLKINSLLVTKSTVPIGTSKTIVARLNRADVEVVSNPEFLREGSAIFDFLNPDRVVIGARNNEVAKRVSGLYTDFSSEFIFTSNESAEMIKYASNSYLAMKISFVNSIAAICELADADIFEVTEGIGSDKRIGRSFLNPGPGWGGSCFPKDSIALLRTSQHLGFDFSMLSNVIKANDDQFRRVASKIVNVKRQTTDALRVCVLGLTFKSGTDDMRDSPALSIIGLLKKDGVVITAYDPKVTKESSDMIGPEVKIVENMDDAINGADVIAILTEWEEFQTLSPENVAKLVRERNIVDGRNVLNPVEWKSNGFAYTGVGR
jgi:UDPglucose 6-dehydrogenase